jgi:hypothetical protein
VPSAMQLLTPSLIVLPFVVVAGASAADAFAWPHTPLAVTMLYRTRDRRARTCQ